MYVQGYVSSHADVAFRQLIKALSLAAPLEADERIRNARDLRRIEKEKVDELLEHRALSRAEGESSRTCVLPSSRIAWRAARCRH